MELHTTIKVASESPTLPNPRHIAPILAALCSILALGSLSPAHASTVTWDASGNVTGGNATDGSGAWSTTGTNWDNAGSDSAWTTGNDAVIGNGGTPGTITVGSGGVSANSITFNPVASGTFYTITANTITMTGSNITVNSAGATVNSIVAGSVGITKSGTGALTLSGANTYGGTTIVNAGTLAWNGSTTLSGAATVNNGGTFSMSSSASLSGGVTVNNGGNFAWDTTARATDSAINIGSITLQSGGVLNLINTKSVSFGANDALFGNQVLQGAGTVNQSGGGVVDWWTGSSLSGFSGTYNVLNGIFSLQGSTSANMTTTATVNLTAGTGFLDLRTQNFGCDQLTGGGTVGSSYSQADTLTVGTNNGSSIFSGVIKNGGISTGSGVISLTKTGTGIFTLSGANTYSGATTINGGILEIAPFGTDASSAVTVNAGTLQVDTTGKTLSSLAVSNTAADLVLTTSTSATTTVTGAFNEGSNYTVAPVFSGLPLASSTFNLITAGSITGSGTGSLNFNEYGPTRVAGNLVVNGTKLQLVVTTGAANLIWNNAAATGVWNLNTDANFNNGGSNDVFKSFDAVTFNDTAPAGTVTLSGSLAASSVTVSTTSNYTFSGAGSIVGAGTLTKSGAGTLTILNTNIYTGSTTISSGTLQLGNGTQSGSIANTSSIVNNGALVLVNPTAQTYAGAISGAGTVTVSGTGLQTFTGANSYSGATTINSGAALTIQGVPVYGSDAFQSTVTVNSGGVLNLQNAVAGFANRSTPRGKYTGAGTLNITGPGWVDLSSAFVASNAVTITGQINVLSGGFGNDGGLASEFGTCTAPLFLASGAYFDLRGANTTTQFDALTGSGTVIDSFSNATLALGVANGSGIFGGVIQNGGTADTGGSGVITLIKTGTGTQTFTGANTYTGSTTVNGGTLKLDFSGSGAPASNIISNSSALTLTGTGALAINGGATAANTQAFASTTLTGSSAPTISATRNATPQNLVLNLGAITRNLGTTLALTLPSGTLSSSNGILTSSGTANTILNIGGAAYATVNGGSDWAAKDGSNTFIVGLSSIGGYTASTSTTLSGNADIANGVTTTTLSGSSNITSLRFNQPQATTVNIGTGNTLVAGGILETGSVANNLSTISGGTLMGAPGLDLVISQNDTSNALAISSVIANNTSATGLTKSGAGTLTLTGSNTFTGADVIDGGVLNINADAALGSSSSPVTFVNSATLQAGANNITLSSSRGITLNSGVTGTIDTGTNTMTINGAIGGTGALLKTSTGTLVLGGANTYTGATTISSGTLSMATTGSISTSSPLVIGSNGSNGATLQVTSQQFFASLTTAAGSTGDAIIGTPNGNAFYKVNGLTTLNAPISLTHLVGSGYAAYEFAGITGTGAGAGNNMLTFQSTTQSYVQADAGTYNFSGNVLFASGGNWNFQGVDFFPATASLTLNSGVVVKVNSAANYTVDGLNGSGNWQSTNGQTSTLTIGSASGSGTFAGTLTEGGGLLNVAKTGAGTEVFTGADSYAGTTNINQGILQLGNGGTTGSITASSGISGSSGGILAFDYAGGSGPAFNRPINGPISVSQIGTGVATVTSSNSYTGGTVISAGTLNINADAALGGSASGLTFTGNGTLQAGANNISLVGTRGITLNSGVTGTIDTGANAMTINGSIGSSGSLTKIGAGTLTLAGADNYGGVTTVSVGKLYVTGSLNNTASVSVSNGAALAGTGLVNGAVTVNGGGLINLVDNSIGTLTLGNGLTIGSNSTASVLDFEGNGGSFDMLNISGGSLSLSGSTTINITALAGLNAGTYNLMTYSGTSGAGTFTLGSTFVSGKNLSLLNTGTSEELLIAGAAAYWKGGNGTSWSAAGPTNWTADAAGTTGTTAPTSTVDVFFNANGVNGPLTTSLGANFDVNSLNFNSNATGSTTVSDGTFGLTLESGGITVSSGAAPATVNVKSIAVNGNQAWANNSGNLFTVSSPVGAAAASGTTTLTVAGIGAGNTLLSGAITDGTAGGKLALMVNGASDAAILDASNTYSGGTIITSGTLQVGNNDASGTLGSGAVADGGVLAFDRTDTSTVSNLITGGGGIIQAGSGTVILTNSNTFNGAVTISAGTLQLGNGTSTNGYLNSPAITDNATLAIANPSAQVFSSVVSGAGSIVKSGTGTLTLNGANTSTGGVVVRNGTLKLGISSALGSNALTLGMTGDSGPTLDFGGFSPTLTSLTVGSNVTNAKIIANTTFGPPVVSGATTLNSPLTIAGGPNGVSGNEGFETDGPITGNGGGSGNDTLIFNVSGANEPFYWQIGGSSYSFLGNIHFEGGQTGIQGFIPGSNQLPSSAMITIDAGSTVHWNNFNYVVNETIDGLSGGGTMNVNNANATLNLTINSSNSSNNGNRNFSGVLSGLNSLTKTGAGTQIFSGAESYTGPTNIYQGVLQIGIGGTNGSLSSSTAISGSTGGTLVFNTSTSGTISNSITGGIGVTQAGSGALTLTGNNTYGGTTSVTGGTLICQGNLSGNATVSSGTLGVVGTIGGNLTVGNGLGTASSSVLNSSLGLSNPGNNNYLTVSGSITLNSDSLYKFSLNSNIVNSGFGNADILYAPTGTLTLGGSIAGVDVGNTLLTPGSTSFVIGAAADITGTFNGIAEGGLIQIGQNWFSIDYGINNPGELVLTSAIPEPGTWATILLGFGMLVGLQRRRRRS